VKELIFEFCETLLSHTKGCAFGAGFENIVLSKLESLDFQKVLLHYSSQQINQYARLKNLADGLLNNYFINKI